MVHTSTPGKLMLFGEHAVVYGQPCIVTAISDRLNVSVEETTSGTVDIHAPQVADTRFVQAALANMLEMRNISHHGISLATENSFSSISGFGSSAAVTVGTLKALSALFHKDLSDRELFDMAYKTILDVQSVGSGFDVAASVFGGTLFYKKGGEEITPILGDMSHVSLVVAYCGVKADTTALIAEVAQKNAQFPEKTSRIFAAIGDIVIQAKEKMEKGDFERVGKLMDFNQEYLRDLGVSTEKLEDGIHAAKKAGAWGAKLSGAGGGDCIIAITSPDTRLAVEQAITKTGAQIVPVTIHAPGVLLEENI